MVNFSIMGLSYNTIIGIQFLIYYLYDDNQKFGLSFDYYTLNAAGSLSASNVIFVGIAVIPISLFIIFDKCIIEFRERAVYNAIPKN